jgi:hypothetical protein
MTDSKRIEHWLCVLRGAERQLDAARLRSDVDYAARRLMNAKCELTRSAWIGARTYWSKSNKAEEQLATGAPVAVRRASTVAGRSSPSESLNT